MQIKRNHLRFKKAFTMIELIFVIVVLGILAALALPRMDRDLRQEAADNILSAIRYTQHMALMDDKTNPDDVNWQQTLWMIKFTGGNNAYYTVSSDIGPTIPTRGTVNKTESAIDPANGKYMYNSSGAFSSIGANESPNIFLGHKYGINAITFSAGCNAHNSALAANVKHLAFDNLGRPHSGLDTTATGLAGNDYATYISSDCNITFAFSNASINPLVITIRQETGYASNN